jgi:hypothetical protein
MTQTELGMTRSLDHVTSLSAAEKVQPDMSKLQAKVLAVFRTVGDGLTDSELTDWLARYGGDSLAPSTARRRRTDLVTRGLLRDSGTTRKNAYGNAEIVWCLAKSENYFALNPQCL